MRKVAGIEITEALVVKGDMETVLGVSVSLWASLRDSLQLRTQRGIVHSNTRQMQ